MSRTLRTTSAWSAAAVAAALLAATAEAVPSSAPPVGPLPPGPTATVQTKRGELVSVALPRRGNGRVWRIARAYDGRVVAELTEADVGGAVVLVFKARGIGRTTISFGLTRGETARAYESRRFVISVR